MSETCEFDFDTDVPIDEIRHELNRFGLAAQVSVLNVGHQVPGFQRHLKYGVTIHEFLRTDPVDVWVRRMRDLARYLLSISKQGVVYFPDIDDRDDEITFVINVDEILKYPPGYLHDGCFVTILIERDSRAQLPTALLTK